jgi:hypothetical protein
MSSFLGHPGAEDCGLRHPSTDSRETPGSRFHPGESEEELRGYPRSMAPFGFFICQFVFYGYNRSLKVHIFNRERLSAGLSTP